MLSCDKRGHRHLSSVRQEEPELTVGEIGPRQSPEDIFAVLGLVSRRRGMYGFPAYARNFTLSAAAAITLRRGQPKPRLDNSPSHRRAVTVRFYTHELTVHCRTGGERNSDHNKPERLLELALERGRGGWRRLDVDDRTFP